jgi:hypothetical protein
MIPESHVCSRMSRMTSSLDRESQYFRYCPNANDYCMHYEMIVSIISVVNWEYEKTNEIRLGNVTIKTDGYNRYLKCLMFEK